MELTGLANIQPRAYMTESDLFDKYLTEYQTDFKRIIGKFRHAHHQLDHDEVLSEVNVYMLKKKEDIINYRDEEKGITEFTHTGFKKAAYSYAKNLIKWTHIRKYNSKYVSRRVDGVHHTEDGEVTTFELLCDTVGEEDDSFEFDSSAKSQYVAKLLTQYSDLLTPNELNILNLLREGKNQYTIGDELGVTHQAISIAVIKLVKKIRQYLHFDYKTDESPEKIVEGREAIKALFGPNLRLSPFTPEDSKDLLAFLGDNYKTYTLEELAKIFKNGKFNKYQIMGAMNFKGLGGYIRRKVSPKKSSYSEEDCNRIIELAAKGKYIHQIADSLNRKTRQIAAKCTSLVKQGRLSEFPRTIHKRYIHTVK